MKPILLLKKIECSFFDVFFCFVLIVCEKNRRVLVCKIEMNSNNVSSLFFLLYPALPQQWESPRSLVLHKVSSRNSEVIFVCF